MSARSVTLRGQRRAESLMVDTLIVERQTGEAMDPDTLEMVPVFDTVYEGKGRIQRWDGAGSGSEPVVGSVEFGLDTFFAQLPISVVGVLAHDRVRVLASPLDDSLAGLTGTVRSAKGKTHATKRVLLCEEVSYGDVNL